MTLPILEPEFQKLSDEVKVMPDMRLEYLLNNDEAIESVRDGIVKDMTMRTKQNAITRASEIEDTVRGILIKEAARRWKILINQKDLIAMDEES